MAGPNNGQGKFPFAGLIILEMANNHQGRLAHGLRIIEEYMPLVRKAGVRAAMKIQLRNINSFIHPEYLNSTENKHISRFLSTKLSADDFGKLIEHARSRGFTTMATPYDEDSVDLISHLGIEVIKIASASSSDWPLLEKIVRTGKPIICSTGALTLDKVDNIVSYLIHRGAHFAIMHCPSIYPTPNHKLHLDRIRIFRERYPDVVVGFSTHEPPDNVDAVKIAYAMGARVFEKHIGVETEDIKLNSYSSRPDQFEKWLASYNEAISMSGTDYDFTKRTDPEETESVRLQMRGVYSKSNIKTGAPIARSDVFFAMPLQSNQMASGQWRLDIVADRDYKAGEALPVSLLPGKKSKREIIYQTIHNVKGMLNMARVPINYDSGIVFYHHQGLENFSQTGAFVIECFRHTYAKNVIVVLPGQSHPVFYHKRKDKTYQLLWGVLEVQIEGRERILEAGDTLFITRGIWHGFYSPGGAIFEEISNAGQDDDMCYADQMYNLMDHKSFVTRFINWGRHQVGGEDLGDKLADVPKVEIRHL